MVFVYLENDKGIYKKSAFEIITYGKYISNQLNSRLIAITVNPVSSREELYRFGVNHVIEIFSEKLKIFDTILYAKVLMKYLLLDFFYLVVTHSSESTAIIGQIAMKKNIPLITNIIKLPKNINPFIVERKSFSGKGIMEVKILNNSLLMSIAVNSIEICQNFVEEGTFEKKYITDLEPSKLKILSIEEYLKKISLKNAKIVISGGKGLKSPKNWSMIEILAKKLNAAIACTKPVSDLGWRPHSEHVGQTGKVVAPNIYFAIGISGSIQHLAGMNQSKIIIVINSDPNAPFFKFADYGIIGDAFKIVPKLIDAIN